MRISRTYIAGLGATGVLIASSVMLLVVVSTFVAFRDWSDGPGARLTGLQHAAVVGANAAAVVVDPPASREVGGGTARAAAPRGAAAMSGLAGGTTQAVVSVPPDVASPIPQDQAVADGEAVPIDDGSLSLPPTPQARGPDLVDSLASGLGDTTAELTSGLGTQVGQINEPLGQTVENTGQGAADLLHGVGDLDPVGDLNLQVVNIP